MLETYAAYATFAGLAVGIVGFIYTILQIRRAQSAAEAASAAARSARESILRLDSIQDLTEVQALLHQLKVSVVTSVEPTLLADRCDRTRRVLIRLRKQMTGHQNSDQIIQSSIFTFKQLENRLMTPQSKQRFDPSTHYTTLNEQLDSITELLVSFKHNRPES